MRRRVSDGSTSCVRSTLRTEIKTLDSRSTVDISMFWIYRRSAMFKSHSIHPAAVLMACALALTYSVASLADDMVSFSTGGYARGLRSEKLMHKIDTNGDGMISKR